MGSETNIRGQSAFLPSLLNTVTIDFFLSVPPQSQYL
ncbi:hypothetical protein LEMLEM_LOCUS2489 [Lemmus lemmus]